MFEEHARENLLSGQPNPVYIPWAPLGEDPAGSTKVGQELGGIDFLYFLMFFYFSLSVSLFTNFSLLLYFSEFFSFCVVLNGSDVFQRCFIVFPAGDTPLRSL